MPQSMTRRDLLRRSLAAVAAWRVMALRVFDVPSHVVDDPNRDERSLLRDLPSGRLL
jgi:hypothetical protein